MRASVCTLDACKVLSPPQAQWIALPQASACTLAVRALSNCWRSILSTASAVNRGVLDRLNAAIAALRQVVVPQPHKPQRTG